MKSCKYFIGLLASIMLLIPSVSFANTEEVLKEILDEAKKTNSHLKDDIPGLYTAVEVKKIENDAKLLYEKAPGMEMTGLSFEENKANVAKNYELSKNIPTIINEKNGLEYWYLKKNEWDLEGLTQLIDYDETTYFEPTVIVDKHLALFCKPSDKLCKSRYPEDDPREVFDDINFGKFLSKMIISPLEERIVFNTIRNIADPSPSPKYKEMMEKSDLKAEEKQTLADALRDMTASQIAFNSLNNMYIMRKELTVKTSGSTSKEKKVTSLLKVQDIEAKKRFLDPLWKKKVDEASSAALLRELVHINAYLAYMAHQAYLQNERIELLLAAKAASGKGLDRAAEKFFTGGKPGGF